jgi:hypothetical protein
MQSFFSFDPSFLYTVGTVKAAPTSQRMLGLVIMKEHITFLYHRSYRILLYEETDASVTFLTYNTLDYDHSIP